MSMHLLRLLRSDTSLVQQLRPRLCGSETRNSNLRIGLVVMVTGISLEHYARLFKSQIRKAEIFGMKYPQTRETRHQFGRIIRQCLSSSRGSNLT